MSQIIVQKTEAGMRLDQWLVARKLYGSRQAAKAALDAGLVRVGRKRVVIAKWAVKTGDAVTVMRRELSHRAREKIAGEKKLNILYEDGDLICINKPAGVAVVATSHSAPLTVVDMVRAYLRRKYPGARGTYVKALHRLDVETSGAVLLAKSKVGESVSKQFKIHSIDRRYMAVVSGAVEDEGGTISMSLEKGEFGSGRKVAPAPLGKGKRAITHFQVAERYTDASLLKLRVETGRTHQIRVHCASLGHPLLGDKLYGQADGTSIVGAHVAPSIPHCGMEPPSREHGSLGATGVSPWGPTPRLALHAEFLKFYLPTSGKKVECRAPLPEDMQRIIDQCRERC